MRLATEAEGITSCPTLKKKKAQLQNLGDAAYGGPKAASGLYVRVGCGVRVPELSTNVSVETNCRQYPISAVCFAPAFLHRRSLSLYKLSCVHQDTVALEEQSILKSISSLNKLFMYVRQIPISFGNEIG